MDAKNWGQFASKSAKKANFAVPVKSLKVIFSDIDITCKNDCANPLAQIPKESATLNARLNDHYNVWAKIQIELAKIVAIVAPIPNILNRTGAISVKPA